MMHRRLGLRRRRATRRDPSESFRRDGPALTQAVVADLGSGASFVADSTATDRGPELTAHGLKR